MSAFVRALVQKFPFGPYAQLLRSGKDPQGTQLQILKKLLTTAVHTDFGKRHQFAEILREKDLVKAYQQRVPLAAEATMRPELDRALLKEPNVLWPGTCEYGALSGGTTSHGKIYPITADMLKDLRGAGLCIALAHMDEIGSADFLKGKVLAIGGPMRSLPEYPGQMISELSGIMGHSVQRGKSKAPKWIAVTPPADAYMSWEDKLDYFAERALDQDVRMLVCLPGWGLQLLRRVLLLAQQRRTPKPKTIIEVWPKFQLLLAGGTALSPCRAAFEEIIGSPKVALRETYSATQGSIAFQSTGDDYSLHLFTASNIFYEFVPFEQHGQANAERLTLAEVKVDQLYVPYVTVRSGLWSFCIEDMIRFTSLKPHKILVAGRLSEFLSPMGEEMTRDHVEYSIAQACLATDSQVNEFHLTTLGSKDHHASRMQLLVEFERPATDLLQFATAFDAAMQETNHLFKIRRKDAGFVVLQAVSLPPGTFQRWIETSRGEFRSQSKVPRLRETREVANGLLRAAQELEPNAYRTSDSPAG